MVAQPVQPSGKKKGGVDNSGIPASARFFKKFHRFFRDTGMNNRFQFFQFRGIGENHAAQFSSVYCAPVSCAPCRALRGQDLFSENSGHFPRVFLKNLVAQGVHIDNVKAFFAEYPGRFAFPRTVFSA
jgi:hypothetical protein